MRSDVEIKIGQIWRERDTVRRGDFIVENIEKAFPFKDYSNFVIVIRDQDSFKALEYDELPFRIRFFYLCEAVNIKFIPQIKKIKVLE